MTNKQKEVAQQITELIMANESPEDWKGSIEGYLNDPTDKNKDRVNKVNEIALNHQVDNYLASILCASIKE